MDNFRSNLREIVENRGIKLKFIYETVKINKSTMTELMNGKIPSYRVGYKIAKLLSLRMEDIWYEDDADM